MITKNNKVALTKFPSNSLKTEIRSGFAFSNKQTIQELTVVFLCDDDLDMKPGDRVYVRFEAAKHQWANEVFVLDGKEFILCPRDQILLHEPS